VRRGTASSWTSTNPTLAAGELGFETDTGKFKIGTGSSTWNSLLYAGGGQSSLTTYQYTATAAQTTFSGTDANGNTLSYTVGAIQVYLNGALLQNTADYAATNGTSVVLTAGALAGDSLTILSLATFDVANTYTQAQADALFIADTIVDAKGDIIAATAADTVSRLAVGANDTVLMADSTAATGLKWATPAAGGMTLLSTTTLSGSSTTISSINQTYTNLHIVVNAATTGTNSILRIQANGSTTLSGASGPDLWQGVDFTNSTGSLSIDTGTVYTAFLTLNNYASTAYQKIGIFSLGNDTKNVISLGGYLYRSTSAITSITITNSTAVSFTSGQVLIYGVK
jgi:hypothetical protein